MSHDSVSETIEAQRDDRSGRPVPELLEEIARDLLRARSVLVVTHLNPDGDAIGSAGALALGLRALGRDAAVLLPEPLPERFASFVPDGLVRVAEEGEAGSYDRAVVVDTSEPERVGSLAPAVFAAGRTICIDHHLAPAGDVFDLHLVVRRAAATAELVLALLQRLGAPVDRPIAALLWLGIATDTGWFRFSNTSESTMRAAGLALSAGSLDAEELSERIYGAQRVERLRLLGRTLADVRLSLGGRFAWILVTQRDLAEHGLDRSELDGFVDPLRTVRGVRVSALISEIGGGMYKISLRAVGDVDVERVARRFGGGGHRKAAGGRFEGELADLLPALEAAIAEALDG